uniref:Reverse transcriptase domain-containing protein n=1 Tax=Tanacetum cinerariifolium TaxID=118510 RepID=A0A699H4V2_TANCI|nr:hypothetical protein [Tanacetum cinerariifolium]
MMVMIVNNSSRLSMSRNRVTIRTVMHAQPEDSNELFQKLLEDLQIINKELIECNRPMFFNDNEDHSVQYKEYSSNKIVASNSNQEKEGPPQDSDIRQLIREEWCIEVCEEQKQNMENTILELVEICRQKELYCMHDNIDDLIESALNSKLILINSQRLNKEKHEVKNVVEQPAEHRTRIEKSLQNFRVIHKSSISLNSMYQISPVHAVEPILSTKEPEYSPSMGYEHPNTTPETESDEIIKSVVEELVPIPNEYEIVSLEEENVVYQEEEEIDLEEIQDVVLREKLLSINCLIANIKSLNDNPTPDRVLNSFVSFPISEESDNSLSDNFSPEFETFCDHTKETRSGNTTTHADDSFPEYDLFCFEIELDQERLIKVVMNDNDELECLDSRDEIDVSMNDENDVYFSFITLPSNTVTNPKEDLKGITTRSGNAYQGPMIPTTFSSLPKVVESETKVTKDTVPPTNNGSTKDVQPSVVHIETHVPNFEPVVAPVADPLLLPFADTLILMPKFGPTIKSLLTNKDKLFELARTSLNEHCSAVLLKMLPEKLGDPGKFLIPCDFPRMDECLAFSDLDTSINLMHYQYVFVKVEKFHLPSDFIVVAFYADPRVPLILERSFLNTKKDLIDVYEGELTLRVGKEAITLNLDQTSRYSANYNDMTANRIDVIDMACEEYSQKVLGFFDVITSGNPTPYYDPIVSTSSSTLTPFGDSDFLLEKVDAFLALEDDPTSPEVDHSYFDMEGDILLLEAFFNNDPSLPPPNQGMYLPQV